MALFQCMARSLLNHLHALPSFRAGLLQRSRDLRSPLSQGYSRCNHPGSHYPNCFHHGRAYQSYHRHGRPDLCLEGDDESAIALKMDSDGDFGYDFTADEEELLLQLASNNAETGARPQFDGPPPETSTRRPPIAAELGFRSDTEAVFPRSYDKVYYPNRGLPSRLPLLLTKAHHRHDHSAVTTALQNLENGDTLYGQGTRANGNGNASASASASIAGGGSENDDGDGNSGGADPYDGRTPLERFRSYPRKPLTVSDLTSGAWCELQYWYTLTRLPGGRRTRTPAMRQGSKVHRQLEEEVHTTVRIDITTKEDGFGLRLWNLVQGLRTLRDTGLTRELEVWGMVDGHLVNGVVDSVSSENPNPQFERELSVQGSSKIADSFDTTDPNSHSTRYFLTDVKTRGSLAPVSAATLRPAKIQLLLYHRFLSDMAAGALDYHDVLRRYGLDADNQFSDSFMAQVADLHDDVFFDTPTSTAEHSDTTTITAAADAPSPGAPDLLRYGTLRQLLTLVRAELRLTFPRGAASLGPLLSVQYIYRADGRLLDSHDFPVSPPFLDSYLANYMSWWRGERKAFGVDIEEAFKCRSCDFAPDCSWRRNMDAERLRRARERVVRANPGPPAE